MPVVLGPGDVAGLAGGGARRRSPAQGPARALSIGEDDMLAGEFAGRQCQEQ